MITLRININFYLKLQNEDFFPFVCTMSKNMAPSGKNCLDRDFYCDVKQNGRK